MNEGRLTALMWCLYEPLDRHTHTGHIENFVFFSSQNELKGVPFTQYPIIYLQVTHYLPKLITLYNLLWHK